MSLQVQTTCSSCVHRHLLRHEQSQVLFLSSPQLGTIPSSSLQPLAGSCGNRLPAESSRGGTCRVHPRRRNEQVLVQFLLYSEKSAEAFFCALPSVKGARSHRLRRGTCSASILLLCYPLRSTQQRCPLRPAAGGTRSLHILLLLTCPVYRKEHADTAHRTMSARNRPVSVLKRRVSGSRQLTPQQKHRKGDHQQKARHGTGSLRR